MLTTHAATPASSGSNRLRLALCDAGHDRYLVDFSDVTSIQQSNVISRMPTAERPDGGLATAQGEVPIFSLAQRLGAAPSEATRQYCLIAGNAAARWGLLVDRVHHADDCDAQELVALPGNLQSEWCRHGLIRADKTSSKEAVSESPEQAHSETQTSRLRLVLRVGALHPEFSFRSESHHGNSTHEPLACDAASLNAAARRQSVRQLLSFGLTDAGLAGGSIRIGLNATQVAEILAPPQLTRLPHAGPAILGMVAWRGRAVPVVDLAAKLGLTLRRRQQPTRLIITRTQDVAAPWIGFLSSADIRTDRANLDMARQCEDHSARPDSLLGAFHLGDSTVLIPDLHRVLLA